MLRPVLALIAVAALASPGSSALARSRADYERWGKVIREAGVKLD